MALMYPLPKRTSIPASPKVYSKGRTKAIRLLVIHDGETGEGSTPAEGMGNYFASGNAGGSAHAGFDTDSICTYVADKDKAWAAPGANDDGLHGELAGRAGQTASQWKDADSLRILENGAIWFAENAIEHDVPVRYLTDAQLKDGKSRGITTHRQCSHVLGGTHSDPGPNFPLAYFLGRIRFHVARLTAPPAPKPTTAPAPAPTLEVPTVFLVQLIGTDPVYKTDGFRRVLVTPVQRDAFLRAGVKHLKVSTAAELAAFGPEVKA